jgi:hypothetical protein
MSPSRSFEQMMRCAAKHAATLRVTGNADPLGPAEPYAFYDVIDEFARETSHNPDEHDLLPKPRSRKPDVLIAYANALSDRDTTVIMDTTLAAYFLGIVIGQADAFARATDAIKGAAAVPMRGTGSIEREEAPC